MNCRPAIFTPKIIVPRNFVSPCLFIHYASISNNAVILDSSPSNQLSPAIPHSHHDPPTHTSLSSPGTRLPDAPSSTQRLFLKAAHFTPRLHEWLKDPEALAGVEIPGFPTLQSTLKGLRQGELTVITGLTGTGKTTFLSQLAILLAKGAGVRTLFGSFEIPNLMLVSRMLTQLSGKPFKDFSVDELNSHAAEMHKLPIHFLPFFGSTSITDILQSLDSITFSQKIDLVILDNLQFFLSGQESNTGDKWFLQEQAIFKIRSFATQNNVHVMLVVHPRKTPTSKGDGVSDLLTIDSLAGSAKISQEADNVFLLQRIGKQTRLDVAKNRFTGGLAKIYLEFAPQTLRYNEVNGPTNLPITKTSKSRVHSPNIGNVGKHSYLNTDFQSHRRLQSIRTNPKSQEFDDKSISDMDAIDFTKDSNFHTNFDSHISLL